MKVEDPFEAELSCLLFEVVLEHWMLRSYKVHSLRNDKKSNAWSLIPTYSG